MHPMVLLICFLPTGHDESPGHQELHFFLTQLLDDFRYNCKAQAVPRTRGVGSDKKAAWNPCEVEEMVGTVWCEVSWTLDFAVK